jgi:WD40 repeat protein
MTVLTETESRPNPYIGPRSFQLGEKMYGRDREIEEILDLLIAERIVLLYSPSGTGKTSLVQASLIPRLREEGFEVLPIIRINTELPRELIQPVIESHQNAHADTEHPVPCPPINRYILSVLMSLEEEIPEPLRLSIEDRITNPSLEYYLSQRRDIMSLLGHAHQNGDESFDEVAPEVLIFDQFEEILSADYTDRDTKIAFFQELKDILRSRERWALFCMREDFVPSLDPYLRFIPTRFKNTYRLDLLGESAAGQAIQLPARDAGVEFDDAVIKRLLSDLRQVYLQRSDGSIEKVPGPYIEPVHLQVVCHRLWQYIPAEKHVICEKDIERISSFGNVDSVLASYYTDQVNTIVKHVSIRERFVREWIDTYLITEQGTRGQVMQGMVQTQGLPNNVLSPLVNSHLVRSERRRGIIWFELAHDRLVAPIHTNNLAWFDNNLNPLQRQAVLWHSKDRMDGLLLDGKALEEAEEWASKNEQELNHIEREFLLECRQVHELARVKHRAFQRIRYLAMVSALVSFVAVVALIISVVLLQRAQHEMMVSNSQRLAFAAEGWSDQPQSALLLAGEAVLMNHNPISEQTLRDTIDRLTWHSIALQGHTDSVRDAVFSPDGRYIATASNDGTARIWGIDGNLRSLLKGHEGYVVRVMFSPDSSFVVTASSDSTAKIWTLDGLLVATFAQHMTGILDAAVSADSEHIVTTSLNQTILWDKQGTLLTKIEGYRAAISPDGQYIVTTLLDGTARLWSIDGTSRAIMKGHNGSLLGVSFSPDGKTILTASQDGTAKVWDMKGQLLFTLRGHTAQVQQALYSPNGKILLTLSLDNTVRLWNNEGAMLAIFPGDAQEITDAAFSPDSQYVAISSADTNVYVWDSLSPMPVLLQGHTQKVQRVAFSPDGEHIVSASDDGTARLWHRVGSSLPMIKVETNWIRRADYTPDGKEIKVSLMDDTVQAWSVEGTLRESQQQDRSHGKIRVASSDGSSSASITQEGIVQVWDAQDSLYAELKGHNGPVVSVAFSPDSRFLVTASWDKTARIWTLDGKQKALLQGHTSGVLDAVFSPDGMYVVTASNDHTARIWSLDGEELHVLSKHRGAVVDVDISPDGQYIATASWDKTALLWQKDGTLESVLKGHTERVTSVAFSPEGRRLVTSGQDNVVRQYLVYPQDLLAVAACRVDHNLSASEQETFRLGRIRFSPADYECPPVFHW